MFGVSNYVNLRTIIFEPIPDYDCAIKSFAIEFYSHDDIGSQKIFKGKMNLAKGIKEPQIFEFRPFVRCDGFKIIILDNWGNNESICHFGVNTTIVKPIE